MFLYILIFLFYCVPLLSFVTYLYSRLLDNNLKLLVRFQVWPYEGKDKVDLLVPPQEGKNISYIVKIKVLVQSQESLVEQDTFSSQRRDIYLNLINWY